MVLRFGPHPRTRTVRHSGPVNPAEISDMNSEYRRPTVKRECQPNVFRTRWRFPVAGLVAVVASVCLLGPAWAQADDARDAQQSEPGQHEEAFKRHKVLFLYASTWVPKGNTLGEREGVLVVPTLGVDYEL